MPVLDVVPPLAEADPDDVARGMVVFGIVAPAVALEAHRHRRAQLVYAARGLLTCEVGRDLWLVPPRHAIWIPGGAVHAVRAQGVVESYNVFFDPTLTRDMPRRCCTMAVSPLLRELLIRAAQLPVDYLEEDAHAHLFGLLLAETGAAPLERLHLPMPEDPRLRRIVEGMIADPARRGTVGYWARRAGLGERTLTRLLARETGMSFGRWRRQLAIMLALRSIGQGSSIQQAADHLGYASAGSFVTMFRKAVGVSPARYVASSAG